ncbi:MAG TPA: ABC transporter permease [Vicinamibacterales bacterium]|nr:ABC transporter permease [Vicinamibacterales bacterium]
MVDQVWNNLRIAARWLVRAPGFTLVAAASLAVGIAFNTTLFTVVDAVLLRPLPVAAPDRLVAIYTSDAEGDPYATSSYPDYLDFTSQASSFEDIAAHSAMFTLLTEADGSRFALGEVVSGNYFQMLGVPARLGRTLLPEDDRPEAAPVAVVSEAFWKRQMAGEPEAVGSTLRLRGRPYTVVGVVPNQFTGLVPLLGPEIWVPVARVEDVEPAGIQHVVPSPTGTNRLDRRGQRWLFLTGRLGPGASLEQARAELHVVMGRLAKSYPETNRTLVTSAAMREDIRIHPAADRLLVPAGAALMVLVGLVLLVACANVASMLLARASARQREVAIRLSLGASRGRLVGQLLTESLLLAGLGALAGTTLAWALVSALNRMNIAAPVPLALALRIDHRLLLFSAGVAVLAGLIAGLAPALTASKPSLVQDLRGEVHALRVGRRRWTLRDGLVAAQMAITLVLLVAAALLGRSLAAAGKASVGFRPQGLAVLSTDMDMVGYDETRSRQFWERAQARIAALPGVESVAVASRLPFSINFNNQAFYIPGHHAPGDRGTVVSMADVSSSYFRTLGVPILEGRVFTGADTPDTPRVAVVNETLARRYWRGTSAVGQVIHLRGADGPAIEIVGVCADYRTRTVGEGAQPYVHLAESQRPGPYRVLLARTRGDGGALLAEARRELLRLEPRLAFLDNQTMEAQIATTLLPLRVGAWVVAVVGGVAMLLAAIGLYGVIAYSVARRVREIGLRIALGASRATVVAGVMRQGLVVAAAGVAVGSVLAIGAARVVASLLYAVPPGDPVSWGAAILVLLAVAAVANLVPAWRAARIDPHVALRAE